ncbi:DUF6483 family protein [Clostridium perfringens]
MYKLQKTKKSFEIALDFYKYINYYSDEKLKIHSDKLINIKY